MLKIYSLFLLIMISVIVSNGQGLEDVFVEIIPVSEEAIAADENLNANSKTYRVFVDMAPDYKLNSVIGSTLNPLIFKTSTQFYNDFLGNKIPIYSTLPTLADPIYYDTWVALGSFIGGVIVPLEEDDDGIADGFIVNGSIISISYDPSNDFDFYFGYEMSPAADGTSAGWDPENVIWYALGGVDGYGKENMICIGQFTTDGDFSMELGLGLAGPTGAEQWVLRQSISKDQIVSSKLAYPNEMPEVIMTSPSEGQSVKLNQEINLTAEASDSDGSITQVDFKYITFSGKHNQIISISEPPYTYNWTILNSGISAIYAVATDDKYGRDTAMVSVMINELPFVELTNPVNGTEYATGEIISLEANASDNDGTVTKVEFYINDVKVGEDTNVPYSFDWTSVSGIAEIKAVVTDNLGASVSSEISTITVKLPGNADPIVNVTSPVADELFNSGTLIELGANASDEDEGDYISKVEFLVNNQLVGSDNDEPFEYGWQSIGSGTIQIQTKAYDSNGGSALSEIVSVNLNLPPQIELTAPVEDEVVRLGEILTISALANDQESVVTKVEFLIDGTVIGEDTESPYEYTWIADQLGTKQISARAYDDNGASETSSSVIINVSPGVGFSVMNNKNFSIKTYPNPASEHLILELSGTDGVDKVIYSLMNIYGQQLTYSCIENPDTLIKEKIDLTAYQQGIYVLRVWTNDKYNQENMINSIIIVER